MSTTAAGVELHLFTPEGIAALAIPHQSHVFWWPDEQRYGYYKGGMDEHNVLLRELEWRRLVPPSANEEIDALLAMVRPGGKKRGRVTPLRGTPSLRLVP